MLNCHKVVTINNLKSFFISVALESEQLKPSKHGVCNAEKFIYKRHFGYRVPQFYNQSCYNLEFDFCKDFSYKDRVCNDIPVQVLKLDRIGLKLASELLEDKVWRLIIILMIQKYKQTIYRPSRIPLKWFILFEIQEQSCHQGTNRGGVSARKTV